MTHTVCQPCYDCKYTDCVAVCPVECFYYDEKMLYIDPADCIDCEACVPECPVEAIFAEANVPAQWQQLHADERRALHRPQGQRRRPHHREGRRPGRPGVQEEGVRQWPVVSGQWSVRIRTKPPSGLDAYNLSD